MHPVVALIIGLIVFTIIFYILYQLYLKFDAYKNRHPWILKGTKDGKSRMVVVQDPIKNADQLLKRSENELSGLEFTYSMWLFVDDWSYKYGQWKHIMHKGNESSWPLRCPGMWFHPTQNAIRVYCNTFRDISEYVDVTDIPFNKWFHITVAVRQKTLDVYLNGNLIRTKQLSSLPKQNYSDVYLNLNRGFSGFMSQVRYYDYYIHLSEIMDALQLGPENTPCVDSNEVPPYFSYDWWLNSQHDVDVKTSGNVMHENTGDSLTPTCRKA